MAAEALSLEVKKNVDLSERERSEILTLCSGAYQRDYRPFIKSFPNATHVLGRVQGKLVSHALWITRWLQNGEAKPWRTAFVEAFATEESYRKRGYASAVMHRLADEIKDFDIGGLSTGASVNLYAGLGWQLWRGPLFIRAEDGLLATPEEKGVMILALPKTPALNLDTPLSAEWRDGELW
jgi:aminoglycoside 2'-N-acetyltransferase I